MVRVLPYRRSSGEPAWPGRGWSPRRRLVLASLLLTVIAVMWLVSGEQAAAVFRTGALAIVILPVLVAAWMLGMAITEPFAKRGLFDGETAEGGGAEGWPELFRIILAEALGLGAFSLGILLLGTLHLIEPAGESWVPAILLLLGAGIGFLPSQNFVRKFDRRPLLGKAAREEWLLLLAAIPIAIMLIAATFPPQTLWDSEGRGYDVLEYHLQLPREYAAANSTAPLSHNVYSYFPSNVEMLFLLVMQLAKFAAWLAAGGIGGGADPSNYLSAIYPAQFLHAWLMLLTVAAIAAAPIRIGTIGRIIAILVFLGVPWTIVTGSLAYNEGGMMLFGTLALMLALSTANQRPARWLLIGLLLGLAVGCKMTAGIFFALPVGGVLILKSFSTRNESPREKRVPWWKPLAIAAAIALLVYSPWAIRAAISSGGNPLFPVAASLLGHDSWTLEQIDRFSRGHTALDAGQRIPLLDLKSRAAALGRETIFHDQWSPSWSSIYHWSGENLPLDAGWWSRIGILWAAAPVGILLALLAALRRKHGLGDAGSLLLVILLQLLAWMFLTHEQSRFLLPIVVPLAILIGMGAQGLGEGVGGLAVGALRLSLCIVIIVHALCSIFLLLPEADLLGGTVRRGNKEPRLQPIGLQPQFNWVADIEDPKHKLTPEPTGKILFIGNAAVFYQQGDIVYNTVFDRNLLADQLRQNGADAAVRWLRDQHINYVIFDWSEITRLRNSYGFDPIITPESQASLERVGLERVQVEPARATSLVILRVPNFAANATVPAPAGARSF